MTYSAVHNLSRHVDGDRRNSPLSIIEIPQLLSVGLVV